MVFLYTTIARLGILSFFFLFMSRYTGGFCWYRIKYALFNEDGSAVGIIGGYMPGDKSHHAAFIQADDAIEAVELLKQNQCAKWSGLDGREHQDTIKIHSVVVSDARCFIAKDEVVSDIATAECCKGSVPENTK